MLLVVRVRVDRRHEAALDPVRVVQDLRDGRDAVRRARRVRDDVVLLRVVLAVVDAEDEREVRIGGGRRDDDLLRAGARGASRPPSRVLKCPVDSMRDVDAELAPRELRGIPLGEELDLVAADADEAVAGLDRDVEVAEHRVVLQQVRHRLRVAEVVRRDDLEVAAALELRAQEVPADPAEAVDPDPDLRHESSRLSLCRFLTPSLTRARRSSGPEKPHAMAVSRDSPRYEGRGIRRTGKPGDSSQPTSARGPMDGRVRHRERGRRAEDDFVPARSKSGGPEATQDDRSGRAPRTETVLDGMRVRDDHVTGRVAAAAAE